MSKMKRLPSKRSHSWWWDSHISPKNSKWLAEHMEEMDQSVKRMLKLIEEDGDSFAKKAEMYYQKRPELVSHVEDFYRMYRSLAERYDQLTGDLRKNIPAELQSQGSGGSALDSPPSMSSASPSPPHNHHKPAKLKSRHRAAGFDVFLGGSRRSSDGGSSSSSESDSDPDRSSKHLAMSLENGAGDESRGMIIQLENELLVVKEKLRVSEEEIEKLKIELKKKDDWPENGGDLALEVGEAQRRIQKLEIELGEKRDSLGNGRDLYLELGEARLKIEQLEIEIEKKSILLENARNLEAELGEARREIEKLKLEITKRTNDWSENGRHFEAELGGACQKIQKLEIDLDFQEKRASELQNRITSLEVIVSDRDHSIEMLKHEKAQAEKVLSDLLESCAKSKADLDTWVSKADVLQNEIKLVEGKKLEVQSCLENLRNENIGKCKEVEELNHNFDSLKLKYDTLRSERNELEAKVSKFVADLQSGDVRTRQMETHMNELHLEHARLISAAEAAGKLTYELQGRVRELSEEVERQRVAISDRAEEKREAIRQLCFSLDHYRDGYYRLRQVLHGHKRPAVMAS